MAKRVDHAIEKVGIDPKRWTVKVSGKVIGLVERSIDGNPYLDPEYIAHYVAVDPYGTCRELTHHETFAGINGLAIAAGFIIGKTSG